MRPNRLRIEICGIVASGKTTLAKTLNLNNTVPIIEHFRENPFWRDFCKEPQRYMFETEMVFLLQHYHQIKKSSKHNWRICDFSLLLDVSYALICLKDKKKSTFISAVDAVMEEIGLPDLIVYLECPPQIALERIRRRGRCEETSIDLPFLEALTASIRSELGKLTNIDIVTIDSSTVDFRGEDGPAKNISSAIDRKLRELGTVDC